MDHPERNGFGEETLVTTVSEEDDQEAQDDDQNRENDADDTKDVNGLGDVVSTVQVAAEVIEVLGITLGLDDEGGTGDGHDTIVIIGLIVFAHVERQILVHVSQQVLALKLGLGHRVYKEGPHGVAELATVTLGSIVQGVVETTDLSGG
jgi:hypothetical protein